LDRLINRLGEAEQLGTTPAAGVVRAPGPGGRAQTLLRIADLFAAGDKVAARFEAPGTHKGEFAGVPATGKKVMWKGIVIYHVANNRVTHAWACWDDVGLIQAISKP
jgi:hypothetical protein